MRNVFKNANVITENLDKANFNYNDYSTFMFTNIDENETLQYHEQFQIENIRCELKRWLFTYILHCQSQSFFKHFKWSE